MTVPLMILAILSIAGGYLGVPSVLGGENRIERFLEPVLGPPGHAVAARDLSITASAWASTGGEEAAGSVSLELVLMATSVLIGLFGIYLAYLFYVKRPDLPGRFTARFQGLYRLVKNKYFVDEIYEAVFVRGLLRLGGVLLHRVDVGIIEGSVNGTGFLMRRMGGIIRLLQTGYVQAYAFGIILGAIIVAGYLIMKPIM
jgi:NADH-quinone oxidoreductase subunit L